MLSREKATVSVTIYGDDKHDSDTDGNSIHLPEAALNYGVPEPMKLTRIQKCGMF